MKNCLLGCFLLFVLTELYAQHPTLEGAAGKTSGKAREKTHERRLWQDTKTSVHWMLTASYEQFREPNNAYLLAVGVPTTWYSFNTDRSFSARAKDKKITSLESFASDSSIALNTPALPLLLWYVGRAQKNNKLMQFAMETVAATYLALFESSILSRVQIQHRPNGEGLNFFETAFRGDSSWPSGHVIPYFALTFKTLQFYGPYWALLPAAMSYLTGSQRVKDGRHWGSDITGAFFLTAFATEGVRRVAKHKDNHPVYKWIFEHKAQLGVFRYQDKWAPKIVWDF